jgi:hypothetical protein
MLWEKTGRVRVDNVLTRVPALIAALYEIVDELERSFPGRKFTPDGHLVGSIGEAIAAYAYDLELLPSSFEAHDAKTKDGRLVQVKFTAGSSGFSVYGKPDHLIALRLVDRKRVVEVFNGPGEIAWECVGPKQKNGQHPLRLKRLEAARIRVEMAQQILQIKDFPVLSSTPFP